MATYKVIQDIESEDKLIGPLSVIQFIFACVTALFLYLSFIVYSKHAAFLLILFLPLAAFSAFFAIPWGRDQPTEVWALAKIKYLLYPHTRIWSQSGIKNLVTINAPKKIKSTYTNGLTQEEVQGRLKVLAETIDTRGWATKNVNVNLFSNPSSAPVMAAGDDRLAGSNVTEEDPKTDINLKDDVLDEKNNSTAFKFTEKIKEVEAKHRQELVDSLKNVNKPQDKSSKWFNASTNHSFNDTTATKVETGFTPEQEKAISQQLHEKHEKIKQEYGSHIKYVKTPEKIEQDKMNVINSEKARQSMVTHTLAPDILNMASSNDLSVATIQHEVNKKSENDLEGEVVISLH